LIPRSALAGVVAALAFALSAFAAPAASLVLHADQPGARIEPEVQGQFAEHLGRGIYEGVWVGEGSSIPNTRGFRNDAVAWTEAVMAGAGDQMDALGLHYYTLPTGDWAHRARPPPSTKASGSARSRRPCGWRS